MYSKDNPESIRTMFDNIAENYDSVNNIITFGLHNNIKKDAINLLPAIEYNRIIDLCTGTGDIALLLGKKFPKAHILATDFSSKMLEEAKNKILGENNIMLEKADVMALPYDHNVFDLATMFFGMRNLPDVNKAIQSIYEILKPEGLFLVVDIVKNYEKDTINTYFEHFVPKIGSFFSKDKEAYKYLAQSRETYPSHDGLMRILQKNKFRIIRRKRYLNGIISLNLAKKYE